MTNQRRSLVEDIISNNLKHSLILSQKIKLNVINKKNKNLIKNIMINSNFLNNIKLIYKPN